MSAALALVQVQQGTAEWLAERCGHVTASRIADIMAKTKTGPSASRKNYLAQLVAERLTGDVEAGFTNAAMQWGTETEPLARAAYEIARDAMVDQVGFIRHPRIEWTGASPDGLVGADGLLEIKCPNTATHIDYLFAGEPPSKYIPQMAWQIACTGRAWCDFASYDPRMPEDLRLFVVRYTPTAAYIAELEQEVERFLAEVGATLSKLSTIRERQPKWQRKSMTPWQRSANTTTATATRRGAT